MRTHGGSSIASLMVDFDPKAIARQHGEEYEKATNDLWEFCETDKFIKLENRLFIKNFALGLSSCLASKVICHRLRLE